MRNAEVARLLEDIAAALELRGEDPGSYRVRAYQEAAATIADWPEDIEVVCRERRLTRLPKVGPSIAEKIAGYLQAGRSPYLDNLIKGVPRGVFQLMNVPGIGPRKANQLFSELRITSLAELEAAARAGKIRELEGMGDKTEAAILKELGRLQARARRLPLAVARPLAERVATLLRASPAVAQVELAGSLRRRKPTVGDLDLVVASDDPDAVAQAIEELPITREILGAGPTKISFLTTDDFQIDVRVVPTEIWGAALHHFTGSKIHNIALRERALQRGLKINEYGIFKLDTGERIGGAREEEIYEVLGLPYVPPEMREDASAIEAAEAAEGVDPRRIDAA